MEAVCSSESCADEVVQSCLLSLRELGCPLFSLSLSSGTGKGCE